MFFLLGIILSLLQILILVRCVISFVPPLQRLPSGVIVMALTEPVLKPFRGLARVGSGGVAIDFSPMIVLVIISVVRGLFRF
jgi:YggT family protein